MSVVKLILSVCILIHSSAYQRNEGEEKPGPSSPKEGDQLDELTRLIYGYGVNQLQAMYSERNSTLPWIENNAVWQEYIKTRDARWEDATMKEKLGYEYTFRILVALGMGKISRSKAKSMLIEEWSNLPGELRNKMKNHMRLFVVLDDMVYGPSR
ncbi:hypothetical protein GCK32_017280 [Trichostrongylus colubriformis]|uniref:Uncharacterized protein n=1 Tax=Trichostrongylus colubriformis TaxID=6319 RepID=A0AAN8FK67_TRICO